MSRRILPLLIGAVSLAGICWFLYHLLRTGSCATGSPYVVRQECPSEIGFWLLALFGGLFGSAVAISAYPGNALRRTLPVVALGLAAGSSFLAAFGPAAPGDTDLRIFGAVVGVVCGAVGWGLSRSGALSRD